MYIGGIDERALHHLAAEVIDNSMDEAVAGHATRIEVTLEAAGHAGRLTIADNGRGMPVDEHPKYPGKSALEVILTTLHSGGKFSDKAYATSGGLHGVGVSVVNALSTDTDGRGGAQQAALPPDASRAGCRPRRWSRSAPTQNRRGTTVAFTPDAEIFGEEAQVQAGAALPAGAVQGLSVRRASRYAGDAIPIARSPTRCPAEAVFQFPGGLADHLKEQIGERETATNAPFTGRQDFPNGQGSVEWAVAWPLWGEGDASYYCNTIPTPDGGTHEQGLRTGADPGPARLRRAGRAEEGQGHPGRGRD